MLTVRQRNVLDFIQQEKREKGITPSTREIQTHFGFASQTSVMQYIAALERKGFINRQARKARTLITPLQKIRITDIPIYGQIPAGMASMTEEHIEGHVSLDAVSLTLPGTGEPLLYACAATRCSTRTFSMVMSLFLKTGKMFRTATS